MKETAMAFTTRPELSGTFGMVASTHWIASAVGMKMLEAGGNAFDAAVAMGFTLHVVEPHLNGPLGDMPALIWPAGAVAPIVICGQATAPAGATLDHYRNEGLEIIPGSGLLATVIPGAFDAWMLMLRDHGTLPLADVLAPAIYYARHGHPCLPRVAQTIAGLADFFETEWPSSAQVWLPAPTPGGLMTNPALADTWERLIAHATGPNRTAQIDQARHTFSQGFVAQAIDDFIANACVMDGSGQRRKGVLTGHDMTGWQASYEPAAHTQYHGVDVFKPGFWSQGPTLLQNLNTLSHDTALDLDSAEGIHRVTETLKLGFADREAYYGDPAHHALPLETLLSRGYGAQRHGQITPLANQDQRPGAIAGYEHLAQAAIARGARRFEDAGVGAGEPTMAHLSEKKGDTVHIDVVDRWGNMVSATPSGGWLQSNPCVPGLGMPLNSRAQMFWLDDGLPTTLAPGQRPRTTLSPSMARRADGTRLAFGTPGGDQQDQWQLVFLLRLIHQGMNLQQAIDAPLFHTGHGQSSFYPRNTDPGHLMIEPNVGTQVIADLRARGHRVEVADSWSVGRLCAVSLAPDGMMKGAATPRLMQAYAIGR